MSQILRKISSRAYDKENDAIFMPYSGASKVIIGMWQQPVKCRVPMTSLSPMYILHPYDWITM